MGKKELKEIIDNEDLEGLNNHKDNIDYVFNVKLGDFSVSLNPVLYAKHNKKTKVFEWFMKNLSPKEFKEKLVVHSYPLSTFSFFNSDTELPLLKQCYSFFDDRSKNHFKQSLESKSLDYILDNNLTNIISRDTLLTKIIEKDEASLLINFIEDNQFNFGELNKNKKSWLIVALENNAVFCFDIIKDEIKSNKLKNKNNTKNKPF